MAHEVFMSYSHLDSQIAEALCHKLEDNQIKCWIAPRNIKAGQKWADSIAQAIPESKVLIVVLSSNSNTSEQVLREVEIAIQNKLIVVPVRIEDIMPTGGMAYYLATTQWIDVKGFEIDKELSKITSTIKNILGGIKTSQEKKSTFKTKELEKKPEKPKPEQKKKFSKRNLTIIISAILLSVAIAVTLVLVLKPGQTKTNPDMIVTIEDENLKAGILTTLDNMGEKVNGNLTVADMIKLEYLKIASTAETDALSERALDEEELNRIKAILVTDDSDIVSIEGLQYALNLKELMIAGKNIRDISPLSDLVNLEHLDLTNNKISDIESLRNLTNLKIIVISNNLIIDLSPLEKLIGLTDLGLNENLINDIEPLRKLVNLNGIVLNDNDITDISPLSEMRYLSGIGLDSNNIEDISVLAYMRKAKWLLLSDNNIKDLSALSGLNELQWLHLGNNNISDISALADLTALLGLFIEGNQIDNLEVLIAGQIMLGNLRIDQETYDQAPPEVIETLRERGCYIEISETF